MSYSPKYVTVEDVPLEQVPDDFDEEEKKDALEFAESSLELDVNSGNQLAPSEVTTMLRAAVKQKATCELVKGTEDPTDAKLGDLADDGNNKTQYANSFCERYTEIVEKINDSGLIGDSGSTTEPYVYTTRDPDC